MSRSISFVALFAFVIAFAATAHADDKDAVKEELKKLEGKWKVTSILKDGEEVEEALKLGIKFEFKETALEVSADNPDFTVQKRIIKLDATTNPKLMDVAEKAEEFTSGEKVIEGLYAIDGDSLKWCFAMDGDAPAKGKRPGSLESKAGNGALLITLTRVK